LRANGAIQGGAGAFTVGDSVIVAKRKDPDKVYVVGHVGGIKSCGFRIKLTRGDNAPVTQLLLGGMWITDGDGHISVVAHTYIPGDPGWTITDGVYSYDDGSLKFSYDSNTGYWTVYPQTVSSIGYFVSYGCTDGIETQYPYRWRNSTKGQSADRITPGTYDDIIPIFRIDESYQGVILAPLPSTPTPLTANYFWLDTLYLMPGGSATKKITVTSSIPYKVSARTNGGYGDGLYSVMNPGGRNSMFLSGEPGPLYISSPTINFAYGTPFAPHGSWVFAKGYSVSGLVSFTFTDGYAYHPVGEHGEPNPGYIPPPDIRTTTDHSASGEHTITVTNTSVGFSFNLYWYEGGEWIFPTASATPILFSVYQNVFVLSAYYED
jgi:hypothetical protein